MPEPEKQQSAYGTGQGARRGAAVLERLRQSPPNLWFGGRKIEDPTEFAGYRNGLQSLAALYDLQWEQSDLMLFDSPVSGQKAARSFQIPTTQEELKTIGRSMKARADTNFGMMGRQPDYMNRQATGLGSGAAFFGSSDKADFAANARRYHAHLRENDLVMTHTLVPPQINRAKPVSEQSNPFLAARVKEETREGLVIRGCRMLATLPFSDELLVFPSAVIRNTPEDAPYAFGFSIPTHTEGLKFLMRESYDTSGSRYDHPLSARFEEMDAVVVFDDVFVPWERVMLYHDPERCNGVHRQTGAMAFMTHQVACRDLAKTEYLMGLTSLLAESIGVEGFQHIQEKLSEIWIAMESVRALLRVAEEDAQLDDYGAMRPAWDPLDACRNLYPRTYPRLVEIVQQIGASGLVAMPTAADVTGPLAEDIERYYQGARLEAADRIPLFRLAWDTCVSSFAGRQTLYERFFFGDPVRNAGALMATHDRSAYMDRVRAFLEETKQELKG